jgi:hypothetical protein
VSSGESRDFLMQAVFIQNKGTCYIFSKKKADFSDREEQETGKQQFLLRFEHTVNTYVLWASNANYFYFLKNKNNKF